MIHSGPLYVTTGKEEAYFLILLEEKKEEINFLLSFAETLSLLPMNHFA